MSVTKFNEALICVCAQDFLVNEGSGEAPLEGSIPDMTSSTEWVLYLCSLFFIILPCFELHLMFHIVYRHYVNLQKIYQAKAEADFRSVEQRVRNILKKLGRDTESISKSTIKSFCRNARKLKVFKIMHHEWHTILLGLYHTVDCFDEDTASRMTNSSFWHCFTNCGWTRYCKALTKY